MIATILLLYLLFILPFSLIAVVFSFTAPSSTSDPLTYVFDGLLLLVPFYILIIIIRKILKM